MLGIKRDGKRRSGALIVVAFIAIAATNVACGITTESVVEVFPPLSTTTTTTMIVAPITSTTSTSTSTSTSTISTTTTSTSTTTTTVVAAEDRPVGEAEVVAVDAMTAVSGEFANELWLHFVLRERWGILPPSAYFSLFISALVEVNPTAEVGWQTHAGTEMVFGDTTEAYILEDGSVLFATGMFPTRPFTADIDASFGSWVDENGPPAIFGDYSVSIDSESIGEGDPAEFFGEIIHYLGP